MGFSFEQKPRALVISQDLGAWCENFLWLPLSTPVTVAECSTDSSEPSPALTSDLLVLQSLFPTGSWECQAHLENLWGLEDPWGVSSQVNRKGERLQSLTSLVSGSSVSLTLVTAAGIKSSKLASNHFRQHRSVMTEYEAWHLEIWAAVSNPQCVC